MMIAIIEMVGIDNRPFTFMLDKLVSIEPAIDRPNSTRISFGADWYIVGLPYEDVKAHLAKVAQVLYEMGSGAAIVASGTLANAANE